MKGAHTTVVHGETIVVEITAATFDPQQHMLLTGARNGTLKVSKLSLLIYIDIFLILLVGLEFQYRNLPS